MKIFSTLVCALLLFGLTVNAGAADKLQHVVCFKFKSTAAADEIKKVETAFKELKKQIPQITAYQWGTNVSKENRDKGFTHCFILTFKSQKDLETYIEHPRHQAFAKGLGPIIEDVFVIDFWAKD